MRVKCGADFVHKQLREIMDARNRLRTCVTTLAQEVILRIDAWHATYAVFASFYKHSFAQVIDQLKPDTTHDLDLSLDVATTGTSQNFAAATHPICVSLGERSTKAAELLTQYKKQARHQSAREWGDSY